jgi:hypothetical protein
MATLAPAHQQIPFPQSIIDAIVKNPAVNVGRELAAHAIHAGDIALLAFGQRPQIGHIVLNCTIRELHSIEAMVTTRPGGDGSDVSEAYIRLPRRLQLEGAISGRPDNLAHQFGNFGPGNNYSFGDRHNTVIEDFKALWRSETPFEVLTTGEPYPRMLIERLDWEFSGNDDFHFNASLVEYQVSGITIEDQLAVDQLDYSRSEANVGSNQGSEISDIGFDVAA